ncbi:uncharacterized protein CLUP02_04062 [Colletotrichum lupini]|uniref:Uncharacterized protein n=1 Tax=Colletotrichum lupini TaxID=145971 RepID=A0A9Q8SK04_9PEZI|nr:uncharacterized protein CLUP02_04062 [Colletotrichum lupini]UQC78585.1 hypothetical protein CLUP02_04062 [Colletotrichum lupini]
MENSSSIDRLPSSPQKISKISFTNSGSRAGPLWGPRLFNQRRPFGGDSSSSSSSYQCLSDRLHKVKAIGSAPGKRHNRPFVMQTSPLQNMDHPCDRVLSVACWSKQDPSGLSLDPFSPLFAPSEGTPLCRNMRALAFCLRFLLAPVNYHANGWSSNQSLNPVRRRNVSLSWVGRAILSPSARNQPTGIRVSHPKTNNQSMETPRISSLASSIMAFCFGIEEEAQRHGPLRGRSAVACARTPTGQNGFDGTIDGSEHLQLAASGDSKEDRRLYLHNPLTYDATAALESSLTLRRRRHLHGPEPHLINHGVFFSAVISQTMTQIVSINDGNGKTSIVDCAGAGAKATLAVLVKNNTDQG